MVHRSREEAGSRSTPDVSALLELVADPLVAIDERGCVTFWNGAAERFYGVARADALGRPLTEVYTYLWDSPEAERAAREALASTGEWRGQNVHVLRSGERRRVEAAVRALKTAEGTPGGMLAAIRDVTAREAAHQALRESEERFRTVVENSRDGINMLDLATGTYTFMSPAQVEMTGFTEAELRSMTAEAAYARVHPDDREISVRQQQSIASGERSETTVEYRWKVKSGEYRWFSDSRKLVRDASGRPVAMVGISRDITDRKRVEEAFRVGEQRFRALANSMPQLAWTARPDGFITWYNRRWYEYTGTTEEQMRGWGWEAVHDPGALPDVLRRWKASIESGEPFELEFPLRRADGLFRRFLTRAFPLKDDRGSVLQWFGTNTDVTELVDARDALREADRQKDEFLAILSHELRNPLAPIRNSVALLRRAEPASERAHRAVEVLDRQSAQLTRLVEDLLEVSRVTQGKVRLQTRPVELRDLVRRTVEDHRGLFAPKDITLEIRSAGEPLWIEGDVARVVQVVGNLLQNAAKFTSAGGHVEVSVGREHDRAVVRVRDDGAGMDAQTLARLFRAFVQADATLDRAQGGLGLGLALAKRLAELHAGTLEASSPGVGKGSEFVLALPLAREPAHGAASETPAVLRARHRVLLVEDHEDAATSVRDLLELQGHRVVVARDGWEGLRAALEDPPDVVLCDIGIPLLDGYEVARRLRASGSRARLVALTGFAAPEDVERALRAGFDEHLAKPPDPAALLAAVAGQPTVSAL